MPAKVPFSQGNDLGETLSANGANEAFGKGIQAGTASGQSDNLTPSLPSIWRTSLVKIGSRSRMRYLIPPG